MHYQQSVELFKLSMVVLLALPELFLRVNRSNSAAASERTVALSKVKNFCQNKKFFSNYYMKRLTIFVRSWSLYLCSW